MDIIDPVSYLVKGGGKVVELSGKAVKISLSSANKGLKYTLKNGKNLYKRIEIRPSSNLYSGFPVFDINLKNKLSVIDELKLKDKVNKAIDDEGGLANLPKDENGNYLVGIEVDGQEYPVLVGSEESLNKIEYITKVSNDLAKKLNWDGEDIAKLVKNLDEGIDLGDFTKKLDDLGDDYLKQFHHDYFKSGNADELQDLIKKVDDLDRWKLLKENPSYAYELAKEGSDWEKWGKTNFFKINTVKGKVFENLVLKNIKNKLSKEYKALRRLVPDLDERKLLTQVQFCVPGKTPPCSAKGEYFIADQVWVKYDVRGNLVDMIVVDAKLSKTTGSSAGQKLAIDAATNKQSLAYKILKSRVVEEINETKLPSVIKTGQQIPIKGYYKLYGDGNKEFVNIIKLNK